MGLSLSKYKEKKFDLVQAESEVMPPVGERTTAPPVK
jgi:hypothetical protein